MKTLLSFLMCACLVAAGCEDSTVVAVTTACGDAVVSNANPDVSRRDQVAVQIRLESLAPVDIGGTLRVTLTPDGRPPLSADDQVGTLVRGTSTVDIWFPIAAVTPHARVLIELIPTGATAPSVSREEDVQFACVAACPANNVIVKTGPNDACSPIPGAGAQWLGQPVATIGPDTYCSYTWDPPAEPSLPVAPPDLNVFGSLQWQVDCAVVSAQQAVVVPPAVSAPPDAVVSPRELAVATEQRLGIDDLNLNQGAGWPESSRNLRQVWLVVVDTAAHAFTDGRSHTSGGRDNSDHGRAVGLVAHRTACGNDPNCPVTVQNELAFPITRANYETDRNNGGYLATRGQIAGALRELLIRWQSASSVSAPIPLVINLSFGWHSKHDCDPSGCGFPIHTDLESKVLVPPILGYDADTLGRDGASSSFGSAAVLIEIARARCLGALVFTAAGNTVGGDAEGPLLPAGWNRLDAASLPCREILGPTPSTAAPPSGALVSAVGAVDFDGEPLSLTRSGSLPRFTAHGAAVALLDAEDVTPGDPAWTGVVGPLSGTSLATAVVSGAAARLWASMPTHATASVPPAADVEQILFDNGIEVVGSSAELCLGESCPPASLIREISACTAIEAGGPTVGCTAARSLPQVTQPFPAPSTAGVEGLLCQFPEQSPQPDAILPPPCASDAEPRLDAYEAPWAFPQPSGVNCATCSQRISSITRAGTRIGTRYVFQFSNAELRNLDGLNPPPDRIRNARVVVSDLYRADLDRSLVIDGLRVTGPVSWSVYNGASTLPNAKLQVDLANLSQSNITGQAETAIVQVF